MSCLSIVIGGLIAKYKTNIFDLADASGLDDRKIHAWRSSRDSIITPKELVRLARAFCPKGQGFIEAHAALLHGYLSERCTGPGAKLICLETVPYPDWIITTSFGRVHITPRTRRDLQFIHNLIWRNQKVCSMVRALVKTCEKQGIKQ